MRYAILVVAVLAVGCSSSQSPTSPTPIAAVVSAPVVSAPAPTAPTNTPNPLASDPRFNLAFYRQFALSTLENPAGFPLKRQTQAPRIYLRTIDDGGTPVDALTLNETAAALINTAGKLTGVFGLAGLEQGLDTREGHSGWITVRWGAASEGNVCGRAAVGGDLIRLYPKTPGCRCTTGGQIRPSTVKHELGHALGYWHTDGPNDLMLASFNSCDREPSAREIFHARVAYSQPIGSRDPS